MFCFSEYAFSANNEKSCLPPEGAQPFEFAAGDNHLRGFIDLPKRAGPHPVILIIHGSGGTDVFNGGSEYNGHYERLRQTFRSVGLASVVWDKAGSSCSTGGYSTGNPIRERARETVAALHALKQRSDIDAGRIGLWAISQGGWVAPMAAIQTADVSFMILVSAPARDAVSQLEYQALNELRASGLSETQRADAASHLRRAFAIVRAGGSLDRYEAAVAPLHKYETLRTLGITTGKPEDYTAWQNSVDHLYRPDTALRELRMPVLALFGDQDVLVNFRDSMQVYREAFRAGGNRDLTIKLFRGANHGLTVGKGETLDERYLRTMRAWLTKRVGAEKPRWSGAQ